MRGSRDLCVTSLLLAESFLTRTDYLLLSEAREKNMPIKYVKFKKYKHKKSQWITNGLIKSIKFPGNLYKQIKLLASHLNITL